MPIRFDDPNRDKSMGINNKCWWNYKVEVSFQDFDRDGIQDNMDNCPKDINSNQLDTDNDGIGLR